MTSDGAQGRWLAGGAAAAAALAVLVAVVRVPVLPPSAPPAEPQEQAQVTGTLPDPLVQQAAELMDPRPLFLPTVWSGAPPSPRPPQTGALLRSYAPKFVFSGERLELGLPAPVAVPRTPAQALREIPPAGFPILGLGRAVTNIPKLPARGGFVEVFDAATGRVVWSKALPTGAIAGLEGRPWPTLEFTAAVTAAGFVAPPAPMPSRSATDFPAPDRETVAAIQELLAGHASGQLSLGQTLNPGFYRIAVGP